MMAANQSPAAVRPSGRRIGMVLADTILEWTLITLLLVNAVLSYLIGRFAVAFGLRPPCILCSRIEPLPYCRLLCDDHAYEISRLRLCPAHRRLAEEGSVCRGCGGGDDRAAEGGERGVHCSCCGAPLEDRWISFGDDVKGEKMEDEINNVPVVLKEDEEDEGFDCWQMNLLVEDHSLELIAWSAGGMHGEDRLVPIELIDSGTIMDSRMVAEVDAEASLVAEFVVAAELAELIDCGTITDSLMVVKLEEGALEREENIIRGFVAEDEDESIELTELIDCGTITDSLMVVKLDENVLDMEESTVTGLVAEDEDESIELTESIDCGTITYSLTVVKLEGEDGLHREESTVAGFIAEDEDESIELPEFIDCGIITDSLMVVKLEGEDSLDRELETVARLVVEDEGEVGFRSMGLIELAEYALEPPQGNIGVVHEYVSCLAELKLPECTKEDSEKDVGGAAKTQVEIVEQIQIEEPVTSEGINDRFPILADGIKGPFAEDTCDVTTGSETCEQKQVSQPVPPLEIFRNQSIERYVNNADEGFGNESLDITPLNVGGLSIYSEVNEVEQERTPSAHSLHRRFLFERRESGTDSMDGSVSSETEDAEAITIDHLKAALKAERKARSALYIELEEERSASAIAANQTMAMITRLQEEKSTVQMEALQYQRMMEEQTEYDREALQLLNDLMMKRAKEKQELEKELDLCRKKVRLYKSSERRKMLGSRTNSRCGTCSSFSSAEDSDDFSFDVNEGDDYFDGHQENNQDTPPETLFSSDADHENSKHLISLDESLAEFEFERLAILEQLKTLEDKLFMADHQDVSDNREFVQHFSEENEVNVHHEPLDDLNACMNGVHDDNGTKEGPPNDRKGMAYDGKRLLPLFDAVCPESGVYDNQVVDDSSPKSVKNFTMVQKKLAIAEEVDDVYERLQALEADREFLKHCICSLKKGDKGIDLLQEILQHLRDLRAVELRVRNAGDALASLSA